MERLRDELSSDDPVLRDAATLAHAAFVPEPPIGLQQRVRAQLLARKRRGGAMHLRPATVMVALCALLALAGAAALRSVRQPPQATTPISTPTVVPASAVLPAPNPTPVIPAPAPRTPAPQQTRSVPAPARVIAKPTVSPVVPSPTAAAASAAARAPEEAALLALDATRALRRDHDPERAINRVEEYLGRYPSGDLVEECLALQLEARELQADPRAQTLADDYLRRFPNGRFRAVAVRVRQRLAK